jgi:LmbE family N-acetylglucosaminyl deacetylase
VTLFGAKLLQILAKSVLHISVLAAPNSGAGLQLHNLGLIAKDLLVSTAESFDAYFWQRPFTPNTGRQCINAVIAVVLITLLLRFMYAKRKSIAYAPWLFVTAIVLNYAVYVAGGQVLVAHTSRYLIMVPLLLVMIVAAAGDMLIWPKLRRSIVMSWLLLLIVSSMLLVGALVVKWPSRYAKDTHITTLISFLQQHGYHYALASRETGVTTTYFSHGDQTVIPMGCAGGILSPTNLFYDAAGFEGVENYKGDIPILLQNNEITFGAQHCSLSNVIEQFGVPKHQITIPGYGTALIYKSLTLHPSRPALSLKPIAVVALPPQILNPNPDVVIPKLTGCTRGTTDVVIAHPDDDLLFMNPVLAKQFGDHCIRTLYITAADDGRPMDYWLGRQRGVEAAYALMAHAEDSWVDQQATIGGHLIAVRELKANPDISLVFLRLPDGNVHGEGFASTGSMSLEKISHSTASLSALGTTDSYTYSDVVKVVSSLFMVDKPNQIYTHISGTALSEGDHSDHRMVGALVVQARAIANSLASISSFVGYPSNYLVKNLPEDEIAQKRAIFNTYAVQDIAICGSHGCDIRSTYERYLERCYVFSIPARSEPSRPGDIPPRRTADKLSPSLHQKQRIIDLFKL